MDFTIAPDEQKFLLAQAREAITAEIEKRKPSWADNAQSGMQFEGIKSDSALFTPCGAFVSLHMRGELRCEPQNSGERSLRGCIGRMSANLALIETVRLMAKEAAFGDPRFPPLKKEELSRCHIEISALSPMTPCHDPKKVKVGVHGLYLIYQGRSGVLLPQVPVEQKWNLDEYLEYICIKAGVPAGSYSSPNAQLLTFTAIVFGEE